MCSLTSYMAGFRHLKMIHIQFTDFTNTSNAMNFEIKLLILNFHQTRRLSVLQQSISQALLFIAPIANSTTVTLI